MFSIMGHSRKNLRFIVEAHRKTVKDCYTRLEKADALKRSFGQAPRFAGWVGHATESEAQDGD